MSDKSLQMEGLTSLPACLAHPAVSTSNESSAAQASFAPHAATLDIASSEPVATLAAVPEASEVPEIEGIDYDAIAERVTTDPITFYSNMREPDSVELFLQCREFVRIATEETDAPIDHTKVIDGTSSLTDFVLLGAAREGSGRSVEGMTFRQELRKCIYATAVWEKGFPDAKVDDKLLEYKMLKKKKADAKQKKAEAAAKKKELTAKRNATNWKKHNKPVLVAECQKRGIDVVKKTVADLKSLLFSDDKRLEDEKAAEERKAAAEKAALAALEGTSVNAEGNNDDAMDVDEVSSEEYVDSSEDEDGQEDEDDPSNKYF